MDYKMEEILNENNGQDNKVNDKNNTTPIGVVGKKVFS